MRRGREGRQKGKGKGMTVRRNWIIGGKGNRMNSGHPCYRGDRKAETRLREEKRRIKSSGGSAKFRCTRTRLRELRARDGTRSTLGCWDGPSEEMIPIQLEGDETTLYDVMNHNMSVGKDFDKGSRLKEGQVEKVLRKEILHIMFF